jgi:hypothetical protein
VKTQRERPTRTNEPPDRALTAIKGTTDQQRNRSTDLPIITVFLPSHSTPFHYTTRAASLFISVTFIK